MIIFYRIISVLLFPVIELWLFYRTYKGKENRERLQERFGKTKYKRPSGDIIWLHAVSIGEANSAFVIIDELVKNNKKLHILLTTTTTSSAKIIEQRSKNYSGQVIHQFLPIDSLYCVRSFLDFWQPKKAIFVESEIWPNFVYESKRIGIKIFLLNARISEKSFKLWLKAKKIFFFKIFDNFDKIFAQSSNDQEKFQKLTKNKVLFLGNLKSQSADLEFDKKELAKLEKNVKDKTIFLCASTHPGEEEIILECHNELKQKINNLLTIIVPRHPKRSEDISQLLKNINFAKRSNNHKITNNTEIYLADTLNELGIFYSLANFAVIGGSLVDDIGGHNPFEAIRLNCAVISGDKTHNFKDVYQQLEQTNSCIITKSKPELIAEVQKLIESKKLSQELLKNAKKLVKNDNFVQKIVESLD